MWPVSRRSSKRAKCQGQMPGVLPEAFESGVKWHHALIRHLWRQTQYSNIAPDGERDLFALHWTPAVEPSDPRWNRILSDLLHIYRIWVLHSLLYRSVDLFVCVLPLTCHGYVSVMCSVQYYGKRKIKVPWNHFASPSSNPHWVTV